MGNRGAPWRQCLGSYARGAIPWGNGQSSSQLHVHGFDSVKWESPTFR